MLKKILFKPFKINKPVYLTSFIAIIVSIIICLIFQEESTIWMDNAKSVVTKNLGWFFIITVNIILIYSIYIALSKYGKIRLGGDKAKPEFTTISWFAMLFSTGMGIGVMYFGVGEPVSHFISPPRPSDSDSLKAIQSMDFTFLHWGLHAWSIYAIVGLALAFFSYNKKLPATFRSLFYPFLGNKIQGWWGHTIDILSVIATIFGLSATLGFGVQQLNGGLNFLFGWDISPTVQSILILVVVSIATLSVVSGLDKGLKYLSNGNMLAALIFMLFIFITGPTLFIFKSYIQNIGSYLSNFIALSFWNDSYRETGWQNDWTVFYWAWWISWSPFVGTFIARISRGRTIREFLLGVLLVPAILTFLWMTVFGGTALHNIIQGDTTMVTAVTNNMETALFVFLEDFPFTKTLSVLAVFLIALFFITSSDSGSLVVDNITSGNRDTPILQRILWAFIQGFIAIALLMGGGLGAIQTAVILTGLPFAAILLMMCYSLSLGLKEELNQNKKRLKSKEEKTYSEIITELLNEEAAKQ